MAFLSSTCDVSTIFNSPQPNVGASVIVGGVQLIPSPFVNLAIEKYRVGDKVIGGVLKLTLNGKIIDNSFCDVVNGTNTTGIKDILGLAQKKGCICVKISCKCSPSGPETILIDGIGRLISASVNEGDRPTWVNMAPYTLEIELYKNKINLSGGDDTVVSEVDSIDDDNFNLRSITETLSWSINEDTFAWGNAASGCTLSGIDGFGNRHIKVNFSLSAVGIDDGSSGGDGNCGDCSGGSSTPQPTTPTPIPYGLAGAEKYLISRLKDLKTKGPSGIFDIGSYKNPPTGEIIPAFNLYTGGMAFMDFRTIEINPVEGSINLNGEIIYRPSGCLNPHVFTTLNIEQNINTTEETLTISGSIQGLIHNEFDEIILLRTGILSGLDKNDTISCDYNLKMERAENFLKLINVPTGLQKLASCYVKQQPYPSGYISDTCSYSSRYDPCSTVTTPTPIPVDICDMRIVSSQITRNISAGEISFSYSLSNAPNCEVAGTTRLDISITHDKPHDNIVEIIIPGRGSKGPLIQNLCCNSAEKYDISIDATLNRRACKFDLKKKVIDDLRKCAENQLAKLKDEAGVDIYCWFKVNDVETIGNTSYKLNRSYIKPSCP